MMAITTKSSTSVKACRRLCIDTLFIVYNIARRSAEPVCGNATSWTLIIKCQLSSSELHYEVFRFAFS